MNFGQSAIISRMVVLTFGNAATDTGVYVFFFHLSYLLDKNSMREEKNNIYV